MKDNKVYAFQYCGCIHESAYHTVSLHRTLRGAELALEFHKEEARKDHEELFAEEKGTPLYFSFGLFEAWEVVELEIEE
jgi:hypothetical protein